MKSPLGYVGLVLMGMALGSVVQAQQTSPSATPTAQMQTIVSGMTTKLDAVRSTDPDKNYTADMAAISKAVIGLCKKEIAGGNKPSAKALATKLLTVQQEYDAEIEDLNRTFSIDHSP